MSDQIQKNPLPSRQFSLTERIHNQRIAQICLSIILLLFGLYTIKAFLIALLWGLIFAIASWPLYLKIRRKWPLQKYSFLLPLLFSFIIVLVFMLPLSIIVAEASKDFEVLLNWVTQASHSGLPPPDWLQNIPFEKDKVIHWWEQNLSNPESASALLSNLQLKHGIYLTQKIGSQLLHRGILFIFSILTLFFLFKDGDSFIEQCLRGSRRLFGKQGENIAQQMIASVHGTLSGLVLVGLGQGFLLGILYTICGTPHAAMFGLFTAIAAMIPFCPIIAIGIVTLVTLTQVSSIAALVILVVGAIVVFVADHFIRPALIGGSTELPFIWVLVSILGGVETWGIIGLFIGPAIMSAIIMLWNNWTKNPKFSNES